MKAQPIRNSLIFVLISCIAAFAQETAATKRSAPTVAEIEKKMSRFAPTELQVDTASLSADDRKALVKLIQAARILDKLQLEQRWSGNLKMWKSLSGKKDPLSRAQAKYFWLNKGPWSALDENLAFVAGAPEKKPLGANFYPEDASKEELEAWMKGLSDAERQKAQGFFTVVRRDVAKRFVMVPYHKEYFTDLKKASKLLRSAAALTNNASLKKFLTLRADAFLTDDYFASDVAWMDLDSPLDVTIGPYETYNDELFGYKAAFEAYINVRDAVESKKLEFFGQHLQDIENNLPVDAKHRNPKIGALSPIVVVNQVFGAGDGNMGVQTAAYNLPNDERVIKEKGSKRVMLKNVQQAKFDKILRPIASLVLRPADQKYLDFEFFFTHILAHELTHGLGPHNIKVNGKDSTPRQELKELYSAVEEAKADVTGLFALQYLMDKGLLKDSIGDGPEAEKKLYITFLASTFRTQRFGLESSHARGMAMQFNYFLDKGAFIANDDGTFSVDFTKIKQAVRDLDREFLTLEAEGDYAGAAKMKSDLMKVRPSVERALEKLKQFPTDIRPVFVTAEKVVGK